jgi:hypothetical protein
MWASRKMPPRFNDDGLGRGQPSDLPAISANDLIDLINGELVKDIATKYGWLRIDGDVELYNDIYG